MFWACIARSNSVIFGVDLKKVFWMRAYRANLGSFGSNGDIPAVTAFPGLDLAFLKNLSGHHILEERTAAFFMVLLDGGHPAEFGGHFRKAFSLGCFQEHCRNLFVPLFLGDGRER